MESSMVDKEELKKELVVVESEEDFLQGQSGVMLDVVVKKETVEKRIEDSLHAALDAKPPTRITEELSEVNMDMWSKVVSRLRAGRPVKVDMNISAMGLLGMFPMVEKVD